VANLKDNRWNPGSIREVIHDPQSLHTRLKRVCIDWRITQSVHWTDVAAWMREQPTSLCIVNTRDDAQQLFQVLTDIAEPETLFHLSTRMCPAHRLEVIARVRQRIRENLPTRVVSTQLIEAGVDLDFPVVFRAIGPLDSIIQAAGRADREGILTARQGTPAGRVIVLCPKRITCRQTSTRRPPALPRRSLA
jgi:CRISPR-associated endonuclease/helicase Cas3